ncbi:MAG: hypothetical protein M3Y21_03470 [Candidatus Eremiobacteraeota bacterium]|nr:hypothetical protein [Candidatus Eremiobacteraeota bacterium]
MEIDAAAFVVDLTGRQPQHVAVERHRLARILRGVAAQVETGDGGWTCVGWSYQVRAGGAVVLTLMEDVTISVNVGSKRHRAEALDIFGRTDLAAGGPDPRDRLSAAWGATLDDDPEPGYARVSVHFPSREAAVFQAIALGESIAAMEPPELAQIVTERAREILAHFGQPRRLSRRYLGGIPEDQLGTGA